MRARWRSKGIQDKYPLYVLGALVVAPGLLLLLIVNSTWYSELDWITRPGFWVLFGPVFVLLLLTATLLLLRWRRRRK